MTTEPVTPITPEDDEPTITISSEGKKPPVVVELVGVKYRVHPPKAALALRLAVEAKTAQKDPTLMVKTLDSWMDKAFGKTTAKQVRKRLDDAEDDLDFDHISQLMMALMEVDTPNPPTS